MNNPQSLGGLAGTGVSLMLYPEALVFYNKLLMGFIPHMNAEELEFPVKILAIASGVGLAWLFARAGYKVGQKKQS